MIKVKVRVYATLRPYLPELALGQPVLVELPQDAAIADLLDRLGIPRAQTKSCFVNGLQRELCHHLRDGDDLALFPPIAGGARPHPTHSFVHPSEEEFAHILDFYHIEWQYEPRSFPLRWDGDRVTEMFTPDFYLPALDMYVELTTMRQSLVTRKNRKLRELRELYPGVNVRLLYKRDYQSLLAKYGYRALTPTTLEEIDHILLSSDEIQNKIRDLAEEISRDYAGKELRLVGILKGVAFFMTDLMRQLTVPVSTDYMFITKYTRNGSESGAVRILKDLDQPIEGSHLLLVEDIVDTGLTLRYILSYLQARKPASLRVCTLLDRRARRLVDQPLDYVAFEIPDEFVVGYGLDHRELYRNLPFICVLKPEAYRGTGDGG